MIGETVSHYRIVEKLGEGGMGVVYKAEDTKLKRTVALKFLPPDLTRDEEAKRRFIHEAQAASALQHNNICNIHDIDETPDGQMFIVMDLYEGETLKKKIERGSLKIEETTDLAIQIVQGLAEAHQHGIVHRDIKPANILITKSGVAKIVDFGLAKLSGATKLTKTGSTLGTIAYMSPERLQGSDVDARGDIFSFGVMLYEMLTGKTPFRGDHEAALMYSIVNEEPEPLQHYIADVPSELIHILSRALEKSPADRYKTMDDLLIDLRRLRRETSGVSMPLLREWKVVPFSRKRIILGVGGVLALLLVIALVRFLVLAPGAPSEPIPITLITFQNQTGDTTYNYLRDVIPNLLITSLEQSRYLRVTTWERMRDLLKQMGKPDVKVVDTDLGFELCRMDSVGVLGVGTYTKAGETFVTDVKLIDASSKKLLRSASSTGEGVASILKTQIDELSRQISSGIGISESAVRAEQKPVTEVTTASIEAYRYYQRGIEEADRYDWQQAALMLEKAVELDTSFAMAYHCLSGVYSSWGRLASARTARLKAMTYADRASTKEKLLIAASYARDIEGNIEKRFQILRQCEKEYPKEKRVHLELGYYLVNYAMQYDQAIDEFSQAAALDPNLSDAWNMMGYCYLWSGNYAKAIESLKRYASVVPGDPNPFDTMGEVYFYEGRFDEAIAKWREASRLKPGWGHRAIAYVYGFKEEYSQTFKSLDELIVTAASKGEKAGGYWYKAFYEYWLGNLGKCLENLNIAAELAQDGRNDEVVARSDWLRGWVYYDRGMLGLSKRHFRRWTESASPGTRSYVEAQWATHRGLVQLKEGKIDSARQSLADINLSLPSIVPRNRDRIQFYYNLLYAELSLVRDSPDEVIALWEKPAPWQVEYLQAIWRYNMPFLKDVLARAYIRKGEIDKAIAAYEQLISTDPNVKKDRRLIHPLYHYRLAKLYEQKGLKGNAIKEYQKFLDIWKHADNNLPEPPDARKRLAKLRSTK